MIPLAAFALQAVLAQGTGAPQVPPTPAQYATDVAGVIDPARLAALNQKLAAFERETSSQVVVYVDRKLPEGATLEGWSTEAMNAWGIGQEDRDNGVGLFVFVGDRQMRIEVGSGLERAITNETARRIIHERIRPHFKKNDFTKGVEAGVDAILEAARAAGYRGNGETGAERKARQP